MEFELLDDMEDLSNEGFSLEELTSDVGSGTDEDTEFVDDDEYLLENQEQDEEEEFEFEVEGEQDFEDESEEDSEDEEEHEENDEEEVSYAPFVEALIEDGVIEWDGETEYEDTPEGFRQMIEDTAERRTQSLIESLPEEVQRLIQVGLNGGDVREAIEVFDSFDYNQIDLTDADNQRNIVRDYYATVNPRWSEEKINSLIQTLDDLDELGSEATEARDFFIEKTQEEHEAYLRSVEEANAAREQQYYQEIEEYEEIIDNSQSLAGLPFRNEMEKQEFKRYIFEVGEDGMTQAERDDQDRETRLTKEFYKFRKFGFQEVEKKAKTEASVKIKQQLQRHKDRNASYSKEETPRRNTQGGFYLGEVIDFNV